MTYTDIKLQNIIDNDIYACQTSLVKMLLEKGIVSIQDIDKQQYYPDWEYDNYAFNGGTKSDYDQYIQELESDLEDASDEDDHDLVEKLEEAIESLEDLDPEPRAIHEWYLVSHHLASKLNAPILTAYGCAWWGRCTTGMRIMPDELRGLLTP